jgi:hypothetical protein
MIAIEPGAETRSKHLRAFIRPAGKELRLKFIAAELNQHRAKRDANVARVRAMQIRARIAAVMQLEKVVAVSAPHPRARCEHRQQQRERSANRQLLPCNEPNDPHDTPESLSRRKHTSETAKTRGFWRKSCRADAMTVQASAMCGCCTSSRSVALPTLSSHRVGG